ncbi:MAG: alpha-L-fucosidase [Planctomycetota bacterium]|jgi:alpha-L-fucosidase
MQPLETFKAPPSLNIRREKKMRVKLAEMLMLAVTTAAISCPPALGDSRHAAGSQQYEPTWESLKKYKAPKWYRDAKFGIFIHWGVYAVPAKGSEWYPRQMYQQKEPTYHHHRSVWGDQSEFGYKDFIPMFKAQRWNPNEWVELFGKAGARFVVPVAEHHDGFAMYDSTHTKFNSVRMGPMRDVLGELAEAVRAAGMKFGASSHYAFNWEYYNHSEQFDTSDSAYAALYGRQHAGEPPDSRFIEHWYARTMEIVDKYRPDILYFDFGFNKPQFEPYRKKIAAEYYNRAAAWGKEVVLNYKQKAFPDGAAVLDLERERLDRIRPMVWQTDTMVTRRSWGYIGDDDFKSPDQLVDELVDIISKNGVLLLNVGPRADGTIPKKARDILLAMGNWLEVNGEAIYQSRPWHTFGEGPNLVCRRERRSRPYVPFTADDIRFTTKPGSIYAVCLDWPGKELKIKSLSSRTFLSAEGISHIELLGADEKLKWSRDGGALTIELPPEKPCDHAFVFKIILNGDLFGRMQ